jgi:hypothetical protein
VSSLCLLLCRRLGLGGLLPVAADHDDAEEGADHGGTEEDEDYGDADGPDARGEEVLEGVVRVDEGHQQGPDGVVEEDDRGCHEHGEAYEFVEHYRVLERCICYGRLEAAGILAQEVAPGSGEGERGCRDGGEGCRAAHTWPELTIAVGRSRRQGFGARKRCGFGPTFLEVQVPLPGAAL